MTIIKDGNEVSGLCMTCNHANFCIYLASANSSIWSCEEFDDRPPVIESKKNIQAEQSKLTKELKSEVSPYAMREMRRAS